MMTDTDPHEAKKDCGCGHHQEWHHYTNPIAGCCVAGCKCGRVRISWEDSE